MPHLLKRIDTSKIDLDHSLIELVERLAAHNHDTWAHRRIGDGWVYGPFRDESAKTHPDLVPYEQLSEAEKEYDRESVVQTLKAIQALGFQIQQG